MRGQNLFYISLLLGSLIFPATGLSLESPVNTNPLGLGTVPPSAYKSGLIPTIRQGDTSKTMILTGDTSTGIFYRGVVPYRGITSSFQAPADSSLYSNRGLGYLRSVSASPDLGRYGAISTSPSWKSPMGDLILAPQVAGSYGKAYDVATGQIGYYRLGYTPQMSNRPLSMTRDELEKTIDIDSAQYPQGGLENTAQSQQQFWQQMRIPVTQRLQTGQNITDTEPNVGRILSFQPQVTRLTPETQKPGERPGIRSQDIYEQMRSELSKPVTEPSFAEATEGRQKTEDGGQRTEDGEQKTEETTAMKQIREETTFGGIYKSFAAYSDDKFNRHILAAENYMKQGKYYRAADAYSLASIYKPDDPLAYAGKSQALFAAGEYMSSSLFLSRAMEIFPEYAKVKIDLFWMAGDKDLVENRILEAREWYQKSGSAELEFLLSYVYYQLDRMEFARQMIESAAKKMPDSRAIAAMKKAIDERIANQ